MNSTCKSVFCTLGCSRSYKTRPRR